MSWDLQKLCVDLTPLRLKSIQLISTGVNGNILANAECFLKSSPGVLTDIETLTLHMVGLSSLKNTSVLILQFTSALHEHVMFPYQRCWCSVAVGKTIPFFMQLSTQSKYQTTSKMHEGSLWIQAELYQFTWCCTVMEQ